MADTNELKIIWVDVAALTAWPANARKHSNKQAGQIEESVRVFGFTNPILIDEDMKILAGHGRVAAAKALGMDQVPCTVLGHMNEAQKRAYVLADNKIAANASWDEDLLAQELGALAEIELGFDLDVTGFSFAEIDNLIEIDTPELANDPKVDVLPHRAPRRVEAGDIWQLGFHRLVCGDSLNSNVIAELMDGERAQMIFTDPPYNVPIEGHVSAKGTAHREFAMVSGEMSFKQFQDFLQNVFINLTDHAVDGSIHYTCMDWRHLQEVTRAAEGIYEELKNLIVWAKDRGGMGTFYRSRHEMIFAYKQGSAAHTNNFELGQHGRYRTNVWNYPAASKEDLKLHPTVKPVQMMADAMRDVSGRGDIALDLFGGSGSTLIAAEQTGRRARVCEIDPEYCDIILARYEGFAKDEATKVGTVLAKDVTRAAE